MFSRPRLRPALLVLSLAAACVLVVGGWLSASASTYAARLAVATFKQPRSAHGAALAGEPARAAHGAAGACVPAVLNNSALLPGTSLTVTPLPDSLDASPQTQISLLGTPAANLANVSVSGSKTGSHAGRLRAYSQGDGASFVPSQPFRPGETVTVRGGLRGASVVQRFAFRFTVAVPDVLSSPPATPSKQLVSGVQTFQSRPDLHPPTVAITTSKLGASLGLLFAGTYSGKEQGGPLIFDGSGHTVWFDSLPTGVSAANLQVQRYDGRPVLTWWQGHDLPQGSARARR